MPLFGHKENKHSAVDERDTVGHSGLGQGAAGTTHREQGYGAGAGAEPGYAAPNQTYEAGATGMGHRTHGVDDGYHTHNVNDGHHAHNANDGHHTHGNVNDGHDTRNPNNGLHTAGVNDGLRTHGTGQPQYGAGAGGEHGAIMPAAATQTHGGGKGTSTTGKIEHAIGSAIGSESLKAKGIQKEREANALKVQSSEIAEAEKLEQEALMRRERAVGHGAHPHNKHLGGIPPSGTGV